MSTIINSNNKLMFLLKNNANFKERHLANGQIKS